MGIVFLLQENVCTFCFQFKCISQLYKRWLWSVFLGGLVYDVSLLFLATPHFLCCPFHWLSLPFLSSTLSPFLSLSFPFFFSLSPLLSCLFPVSLLSAPFFFCHSCLSPFLSFLFPLWSLSFLRLPLSHHWRSLSFPFLSLSGVSPFLCRLSIAILFSLLSLSFSEPPLLSLAVSFLYLSPYLPVYVCLSIFSDSFCCYLPPTFLSGSLSLSLFLSSSSSY